MLFLIWIFCAVVTSIVAANKGRTAFGWLILGALFGIFALIFVAVLPNLHRQRAMHATAVAIAAVETTQEADTKVCPVCAEDVKVAAVKCRFCGHDFLTERASKLCKGCGETHSMALRSCPHCGRLA